MYSKLCILFIFFFQQCSKLTEEVEQLNIDLEDANDQVDNLKLELGKQQVTTDQGTTINCKIKIRKTTSYH